MAQDPGSSGVLRNCNAAKTVDQPCPLQIVYGAMQD